VSVMFSSLRHVLIAMLALCCLTGAAQVNQFVNPLDVSIADPYVLRDGELYYLYGTANHGLGIPVYTSEDLVHWKYRQLCWTKTETSWAKSNLRAPEVIRVDNTYYLYYTARGSESYQNVCVASSTSPLGPFVDVKTPLIVTSTLEYISGSPFRDPVSGRLFLYVVRESYPKLMYGVELATTPTATSGSLVQLFGTTQSWESSNLDGPAVRYHNGYYYLAYSGRNNGTPDYAVGYATSDSPLGSFTKAYENPILKKTSVVLGPGHPTFADAPGGGELFMLYHTNLVVTGGEERQLAMDRVQFTPAVRGPDLMSMKAGGPTLDLQAFPAGAPARMEGATDTFAGSIDRQRWNVFEEDTSKWTVGGGKLSITAQDGDIRQKRNDARNIFLQYAPTGNFDVLTEVSFAPLIANEQAFLIMWSDQSNYVKLGAAYIGDGLKIELAVEKSGAYSSVLMENNFGSTLRLKLERRANEVTALAGSVASAEWVPVGEAVTLASQQLQVGIGAISPGSAAGRVASFDRLTITPSAGVGDWALYR